jgi:hypothetical protein
MSNGTVLVQESLNPNKLLGIVTSLSAYNADNIIDTITSTGSCLCLLSLFSEDNGLGKHIGLLVTPQINLNSYFYYLNDSSSPVVYWNQGVSSYSLGCLFY